LTGLILALPVLVLFVQVCAAWKMAAENDGVMAPRPRLAVLVPAHNERLAIEATLVSIFRQLKPHDRVVVVADNCSDETADIARRAGAEVIVRSNANLRGKGYALDCGIRHLERTGAPSVVIFVDADCQLYDRCIEKLARTSVQTARPVQAAYLMTPPQPAQLTASIVSFAWKVRDLVRPLGWQRLGLPCQLSGSGMAFPWEILKLANLASDHLTEDVKLGLDLTIAGKPPLFCPDALVTSKVIAGRAPSPAQRARWEHGMLAIMVSYLPRLLHRLFEAPGIALVAMALDLTVPPLALLALAIGAQLVTTLVLLVALNIVVPAVLSGVLCIVFLSTIVLAWLRHGRDILPLRWLLFAPAYAMFKVPLYMKFFFNRQREWVRGER
jgi:glycosyltransferase involved in cell wall biosynthesis